MESKTTPLPTMPLVVVDRGGKDKTAYVQYRSDSKGSIIIERVLHTDPSYERTAG